jgi:hypothetical protein
MNSVSSWTVNAQLKIHEQEPIKTISIKDAELKIYTAENAVYAIADWASGKIAFRILFAAEGELIVNDIDDNEGKLTIRLESPAANYNVVVEWHETPNRTFRYAASIKPKQPLYFPFWPRDIMPFTEDGEISNTSGKIHTKQVGRHSGILFVSRTVPKAGSFFYFQNLTALARYCDATQTTTADVVGGEWPEMGLQLQPTLSKPLPERKEFVISDATVLLSDANPLTTYEIALQYLDHMAAVYRLIPLPETKCHHWPNIAKKSLIDLASHNGCWTFVGGHSYLNAYVSDYKTPAEIMVQLAVLLPLTEYERWAGQKCKLIDEIKEGLSGFYDEKLQTIVRWHPAMRDNLDESEEQKKEMVMDSWYLHHPLMNFARLAMTGDKDAEKILMDSIDFVIKVARHFDYEWPVFYEMDTLKVIKAETQPGQGTEKDVPGAYAHLMFQIWELTKEKKYLNEAIRAAKKLYGRGFDVLYQANNTTFAAKALMYLYKETKDESLLEMSVICIAAILNNVQLWDCEYGNGKAFPTFFAVYPLKDAPYTAAYEELEVLAGLYDYVKQSKGVNLPESVQLLLSEFVRYGVYRMAYYYPPMLPKDILVKEVKTGEIDPNLWVPLEDIQDGWKNSGEVGQEVYGSGLAFAMVPRHYFKIKNTTLVMCIDYPIHQFKNHLHTVTFSVIGHPDMQCRMVFSGAKKTRGSSLNVSFRNGRKYDKLEPTGNTATPEYQLRGKMKVRIEWKGFKPASS